MPDRLALNIVQIVNATTVPTSYPSVTHDGLPFGDFGPVVPVTITGQLVGFGDMSGLTLAYFAYNAATKEWSCGPSFAAMINTAVLTYSAPMPLSGDLFMAVVMKTSFWRGLMPGLSGPGWITKPTVPSPQSNPGDVVWSTLFAPGSGRSITWRLNPYGPAPAKMAPGDVLPDDSLRPSAAQIQIDRPDPGDYRIDGNRVLPTDPIFICGLLSMMPESPYHAPPPKFDKGVRLRMDTPGFVLSAVTLNPKVQSGVLCFWVYQDKDHGLYLLAAAAGVRAAPEPITWGCKLAQSNPLKNINLEVNAILTVFSDRVAFAIVGQYSQETKTALGLFMQVYAKMTKRLLQIMCSI